MVRFWKQICTSGLGLLFILAATGTLYGQAAPQSNTGNSTDSVELNASERIKTLSVTLQISDQGADLEELVALDLGLGFPLWLYPLGGRSLDDVPFGAIPQTTTSQTRIPAGGQATFTFQLDGPAGQDLLKTTPQLLAGVQVGDIKRIGLASERANNWILEGYQLQINGIEFSADTSGVPGPDPAQTTLAAKLKQLEQTLSALSDEYDRLVTREPEKFTTSDQQRLQAINATATAAYQEKTSLLSQVQVNSKSAKDTREDDLRKLNDLEIEISRAQAETLSALPTSPPRPSDSSTSSPPPSANQVAIASSRNSATSPPIPSASSANLETLGQRIVLLKGRLNGEYPWFVDGQFKPRLTTGASPSEGSIKSIQVTVETGIHTGADTQNCIYLSTGGHKYLLNSPYTTLSASIGPQQFDVDLLTGPLTAADLRGWGVGVLAPANSQGSVPDRWHPQRILIEVDGSSVYDSDQSPLDRRSLEAVRIIPPAQLDENGSPVENVCSAREVFLWEAGKGQALDFVSGGALPLMNSDRDEAPAAEIGLAIAQDASSYSTESSGSNFSPDYPPFPGEDSGSVDLGAGDSYDGASVDWNSWGTGFADGSGGLGGSDSGLQSGGGSGWPSDAGSAFGSQTGSGTGSGSNSGTSSSNTLGVDPNQQSPFQLKRAWISKGWKINEPFVVDWEVTGDLSGIDHFLVSLQVVRPDQGAFRFREVGQLKKASVNERSCVVLVDPSITISQPYYYLAPCVTAVTKDPSQQNPQSHGAVGPARAVFPDSANDQIRPVPKDFTVTGGGSASMIAATVPASGTTPTAWFVADPQTTDAHRFGPATPGSHVAVRLQQGDEVTVRCEVSKAPGRSVPFSGKQQIVVHLGYMGSTTGTYSVDVTMQCSLIGPSGTKKYDYPPWTSTLNTGAPLVFTAQLLDAADLGVPIDKAEIKFTFRNGGSADPKCTPGIFGLRMYPLTASSPTTINADLVIDEAKSFLVPGDIRLLPGEQMTALHKPLCLAVTNNGPEAIPADVLRDVRIQVKYYLGQYGNTWGEIKDAKNRAEVTCGPYRVTEVQTLTQSGKWQGALNPQQTMLLVPTPPPGHPHLDPDGKMRSTKSLKKNVRNAHKLFQSVAMIISSSATQLTDDPSNNSASQDFSPPLVIGQGPLDYEWLAFQGESFQGTSARYELNPDTQRQRVLWDLASVPGQPDMYRKVKSFMVGRLIDLYARSEHHLYESESRCLEDWYPGSSPWAFLSKCGTVGSAILCDQKTDGPIGVWVTSISHWRRPRSFLYPLNEEPTAATKIKTVNQFESFMNDDVDFVHFWPGVSSSGGAEKSWLKVTLFEDANKKGRHLTLENLASKYLKAGVNSNSLKLYRVKLDDWTWDGWVTGFGIADEISSLEMELEGNAVK